MNYSLERKGGTAIKKKKPFSYSPFSHTRRILSLLVIFVALAFVFAACDTGTSSDPVISNDGGGGDPGPRPGGGAKAATVTFDGNGYDSGTVPPAKSQGTVGAAITLPNPESMKKSGEFFQGWSTTTAGTELLAPGTSYTPTTNSPLYAIWSATPVAGGYTVIFHQNGATGNFSECLDNRKTQPSKYESIVLPLQDGVTTPAGYNTFDGFTTEADGSGEKHLSREYYTPTKDTTLYADWANVITVSSAVTGYAGWTPGGVTVSNAVTTPGGGSSTGVTKYLLIDLGSSNTGYTLPNFKVSGDGVEKAVSFGAGTSGDAGKYVIGISVTKPQTIATVSIDKARTRILPASIAAGNTKLYVSNGEKCPVTFTKLEKGTGTILKLTFDQEIIALANSDLSEGTASANAATGTFTAGVLTRDTDWGVTPAVYSLATNGMSTDGILNLVVTVNTHGYISTAEATPNVVNKEIDLR